MYLLLFTMLFKVNKLPIKILYCLLLKNNKKYEKTINTKKQLKIRNIKKNF